MGLGHYYQFEYFNYHLNTTFILTDNCPLNEMGYDISCVPEEYGEILLAGKTVLSEGLCKRWKGIRSIYDLEAVHDEKLCYKPNRHKGHDFLKFNKQKRDLSEKGGQDPQVSKDQKEVEATCEVMCMENLNAALLTNSEPPSHQVSWIGLDDMCPDCE